MARLTCVPNAYFGLTFGGAEFRLLLYQHLGPPLPDQSAVGSASSKCEKALDPCGPFRRECQSSVCLSPSIAPSVTSCTGGSGMLDCAVEVPSDLFSDS